MMYFNLQELEAGLERKLTNKEKASILKYANYLQRPKPSEEDPRYDKFMAYRHEVFCLYRQMALHIEANTASIDRILAEYTPKG